MIWREMDWSEGYTIHRGLARSALGSGEGGDRWQAVPEQRPSYNGGEALE